MVWKHLNGFLTVFELNNLNIDTAFSPLCVKQITEQYVLESELSVKMNLARRHIRHFCDVAKSKGLEFDVVVLAGVDNYDLQNPSHVNRLYVGITRARKSLIMLSAAKQLAPELATVREMYQKLVGQP
jgi:superfamily I DNA/RNA helicase